jgi:hypothetical protein
MKKDEKKMIIAKIASTFANTALVFTKTPL